MKGPVSMRKAITSITLLVLVTILTAVTLPSFAEDQAATGAAAVSDAGIGAGNAHVPKRVKELVEKRTANTKHFLNDDGTITAEISSGFIHYKDQSGKWQDIDTSVESTPGKVLDGQAYDLQVAKAPFRAHFGKNAKSPQLFEVPGKGHILVKALGGNPAQAEIAGNQATYPNAWDGVDWVRTVLPEGVKSDFFLADASAQNEFRFTVQAPGLDYEQLPSGEVVWKRQGEEVARFRAATVEDAAGKAGLAYQWLEPGAEGLTLVIQADRAWLDEQGREWPVIIDPTVVLQPSSADTYVNLTSPSTNYGSDWSLDAYDINHGLYARAALIKHDISSIPVGAVITNAYLTLRQYSYADPPDASSRKPGADWAENTATWNNKPLLGAIAYTANPPALSSYDLTVTSLIQDYINGGINYGIYVTTNGTENLNIPTREHSDPSIRPKLTIIYNRVPSATPTDPTGTSDKPGRVNTLTPQLSWTHSDPDGDAQASFQVIVTRDSDSVVVRDSGIINSATSSYNVPGGSLAEGVKYRWKVKTKDGGGLWSSYSAETYIYTNRAPGTTPTDPTGTSGSPELVNNVTPRLNLDF